MLPAAVVLLLTAPATATAKRGCNTRSCNARVAHRDCSPARFARCLDHAHYHNPAVPKAWLYRVSRCESRWRRYARNPSGATSYFQFMPGTWASTKYARRSIYSPMYQPLAAAWMYQRRRANEWVCA